MNRSRKIPIARDAAEKAGFWTKKRLGQHLLRDASVVDAILQALAPAETDSIFEIGPGLGALTQSLLLTGRPVAAIEIDPKACSALQERFGDLRDFHLVQGDVMKTDLTALVQEKLGEGSFHIAANLPYYITTPVLAKLLESGLGFGRLVALMQKEVADRLIAQPGRKDYSALSVMVQFHAEVQVLRKVLPGAFTPPPKVDSALVLLTRRTQSPVTVKDQGLFFQVVRNAFGKRRKTLRNALLMGTIDGMESSNLDQAFRSSEIDPARRPETLKMEEFARLADELQPLLKKDQSCVE